jgi:c-di-GMP-binding flagellar brake protein YcgR
MGMSEMVVSIPPAASFLSVGLPLKISLAFDQQKIVYGTTLLGWKDHAWLVCEWPAQLGHDADIPRGTPCTVSYLHDGKLVGYRSEIRDLMTSPVPLLFLAYPKTVEEMHLRRHLRAHANEPILLLWAEQGHAAESALPTRHHFGGLLKDLSESGCRVMLVRKPVWLRPGTPVRLEFELPGLGHVTNLGGIVKNADRRDGTEMIGIEFRFNELEYIEYRGWGGSVKQAIEQWTFQRYQGDDPPGVR